MKDIRERMAYAIFSQNFHPEDDPADYAQHWKEARNKSLRSVDAAMAVLCGESVHLGVDFSRGRDETVRTLVKFEDGVIKVISHEVIPF